MTSVLYNGVSGPIILVNGTLRVDMEVAENNASTAGSAAVSDWSLLSSRSTTVTIVAKNTSTNNVTTFVLTITTGEAVTTVETAALHDTSATNAIADVDLISGYSASATNWGDRDYVYVTVSGADLQYHQNSENKMGFWIGFSVQAPSGASQFKYAFDTDQDKVATLSTTPSADETINAAGDKGVAFYADLSSPAVKTWSKVQWLDASGNNIGMPVTYYMDLSKVTLKLTKALTFTSDTTLQNDLTVDGGTVTIGDPAATTSSGNVDFGYCGNLKLQNGAKLNVGQFSNLVIASGANLVANTGTNVTVASSANLVVTATSGVDVSKGTITYNNGKAIIYPYASYTENNLSIGDADSNTFKITSDDGAAVVGHYYLQNGNTYTYYDGVLLDCGATQNADYTVGTGKALTTLKSLTISSGKTLTIDGCATNYGVITNNGTIKLDTGGKILGFSILNDLSNGVFSGLIKADSNTYALQVQNTTSSKQCFNGYF